MSIEAMKLALEALEECRRDPRLKYEHPHYDKIITALRQAIEQAEQAQPVAWMWRCKPYCGWPEWSVSLKRPADSGRDGNKRTEGYEDVPLYTTPQPAAQGKPVAWMYDIARYGPTDLRGQQWRPAISRSKPNAHDSLLRDITPLYTAPPPRQPLTDAEIEQVFYEFDNARTYIISFARAIEAKLEEKNT